MKNRSYDPYIMEERITALENAGSTPAPEPTSWDYSTTETDTKQKWTDGKEIYCRVITGTFNFRANTELTILDDIGNIDKIIDFKALETNGGFASPLVYKSGTKLNSYFYAQMNSTAVIIFYTKTTTTNSAKRSKK